MDGSRDYLIRQLLDSSDGWGSAGNGDTVDPTPLQAALRYRDLGLNVVPIALGTKAPPKGFQWSVHQNKPMTEHEIRACWGERRSAGVALVTGGVSGVVGLDSSGPHHQDSGEAKIRESTAGVSRKPSSDGKACGCSSKHLCGLTAWNT